MHERLGFIDEAEAPPPTALERLLDRLDHQRRLVPSSMRAGSGVRVMGWVIGR